MPVENTKPMSDTAFCALMGWEVQTMSKGQASSVLLSDGETKIAFSAQLKEDIMRMRDNAAAETKREVTSMESYRAKNDS